MERAFYSGAVLCILYYLVILWYTKNKRATFSLFWLFFGLIQLALGFLSGRMPEWMTVFLQIICGLGLILFLAIEVVILSGMLTTPSGNLPVLIVLGACVRGTTITGSLKRRLDKAGSYLKENRKTVVIVSGGRGKGEDVTEASAMKAYLVNEGISADRIRLEEKSKTTRENLEFSKELLKRNEEEVGIVTNNFHVYRALQLAKKAGYGKVEGITAGCDPVLFLNYMVREFFAVLLLYFRGMQRAD